jgi:hypothetical protein
VHQLLGNIRRLPLKKSDYQLKSNFKPKSRRRFLIELNQITKNATRQTDDNEQSGNQANERIANKTV